MNRPLISAILVMSLPACSALREPLGLAKTPGEVSSSYGYVPLDPLQVSVVADPITCIAGTERIPVLETLPDIAVRFAVADVDASGGASFGPAKVTTEGGSYRAILDYINVDTVPVVALVSQVVSAAGKATRLERTTYQLDSGLSEKVVGYVVHIVGSEGQQPSSEFNQDRITVPIYVGVGLRLSADIRALKGKVTLSGLSTIGAEGEAGRLSGTMTLQTLGINGSSMATTLPLPNKLDQTTVEQAILAIGAGRATIYSAGGQSTWDKAKSTPRVVGLYSPIGSNPAFINAFYGELARYTLKWYHPCRKSPTEGAKQDAVQPAGGKAAAGKPAAGKPAADAPPPSPRPDPVDPVPGQLLRQQEPALILLPPTSK